MNRPLPFIIALMCLAAVLPLSGQQLKYVDKYAHF